MIFTLLFCESCLNSIMNKIFLFEQKQNKKSEIKNKNYIIIYLHYFNIYFLYLVILDLLY